MTVPPQESSEGLFPLLDFLADAAPLDAMEWRGWRVGPVAGAGNNRLYRATAGDTDLAIKFTIPGERDRAGREYGALLALREAGLDLAPRPLLLERSRYAWPVVVQTWLEGEVVADPPAADDDWLALLRHYAAAHRLTPERTAVRLPDAVLTMRSAAEGLGRTGEQLARVPPEEQPAALRDLVARAERTTFPDWPAPPPALCRADPNPRNILRRPGSWASVDWENAGWGDPAFEIADLLAHPAYLAVSPARREWVIATYSDLRPADPGAATRIRAYYPLCLVWWVARLARTLYEVPRGLDLRLVAPAADWEARARANYARYAERAKEALAAWA